MNTHRTYLAQLIHRAFQSFSEYPQLVFLERALLDFKAEDLFGTSHSITQPQETVWHLLAQEIERQKQKGFKSKELVISMISAVMRVGRVLDVRLEESLLVKNSFGESALEILWKTENPELREWLLETWVLEAIRCGDEKLLRRYIDAAPELKTEARNAVGEPIFSEDFVLYGDETVVEAQRLDQKFREWGKTAPSRNELREFLRTNPEFLKLRNAAGDTALHKACRRGWTSMSLYLRERGMDPLCVNFRGETALVLALKHLPEAFAEEFLFQWVWCKLNSEMRLALLAQENPMEGEILLWLELYALQLQDSWLNFNSNENNQEKVVCKIGEALQLRENKILEALQRRWKEMLFPIWEVRQLSDFEQGIYYKNSVKTFERVIELHQVSAYLGRSIGEMRVALSGRLLQLQDALVEKYRSWTKWWCQQVRSERNVNFDFDLPENFSLELFWLEIFAASGVNFEAHPELCEKLLTHTERGQQSKQIEAVLKFLHSGKIEFDVDSFGHTPLDYAILLRVPQRALALFEMCSATLGQDTATIEKTLRLLHSRADEKLFQQVIETVFPQAVATVCAGDVQMLFQENLPLSASWIGSHLWAVPFLFWSGLWHKKTRQGRGVGHYVVLQQQWEVLEQLPPQVAWELLMTPDAQGLRPIQLLKVSGKKGWEVGRRIAQQLSLIREQQYAQAGCPERFREALEQLYTSEKQHEPIAPRVILWGEGRTFSEEDERKLMGVVESAWERVETLLQFGHRQPENLSHALQNLWIVMRGFNFDATQKEVVLQTWEKCQRVGLTTHGNFFRELRGLMESRYSLFQKIGEWDFKLWCALVETFFEGIKKLSAIAERHEVLKPFGTFLKADPCELLRDWEGNSLLHAVLFKLRSDDGLGIFVKKCMAWGFDLWETRNILERSAVELIFSKVQPNAVLDEMLQQQFLEGLIHLRLGRWVLSYPSIGGETAGEAALKRLAMLQGCETLGISILTSVSNISAQDWMRVDVKDWFMQIGPVGELLHRHWTHTFLEEVSAGRLNHAERLLEIITFPEVHPRWCCLDASGALWDAKTLAQVCDWVQQYGLITVCFSGVGVWTQRALQLLGNAPKLKYLDLSHGGLTSSQFQLLMSGLGRSRCKLDILDVRHNRLDEKILPALCAYYPRWDSAPLTSNQLRLAGNFGVEKVARKKGEVQLGKLLGNDGLSIEVFSAADLALERIIAFFQQLPDKEERYTQKMKNPPKGALLPLLDHKFQTLRSLRQYLLAGEKQLTAQEKLWGFCAKLEDCFHEPKAGRFLREDPWLSIVWRYVRQMQYAEQCHQLRQDGILLHGVSEVAEFSYWMFLRLLLVINGIRSALKEVGIAFEEVASSETLLEKLLRFLRRLLGKLPEQKLIRHLHDMSVLERYLDAMGRSSTWAKSVSAPGVIRFDHSKGALPVLWQERVLGNAHVWCSRLDHALTLEADRLEALLKHMVAAVADTFGRQLSLCRLDLSSKEVQTFGDLIVCHLLSWLIARDLSGEKRDELVSSVVLLREEVNRWMYAVPLPLREKIHLHTGLEVAVKDVFQASGRLFEKGASGEWQGNCKALWGVSRPTDLECTDMASKSGTWEETFDWMVEELSRKKAEREEKQKADIPSTEQNGSQKIGSLSPGMEHGDFESHEKESMEMTTVVAAVALWGSSQTTGDVGDVNDVQPQSRVDRWNGKESVVSQLAASGGSPTVRKHSDEKEKVDLELEGVASIEKDWECIPK